MKKKVFMVYSFHPEVIHTISGKNIIENFLKKICKLKTNWKNRKFFE